MSRIEERRKRLSRRAVVAGGALAAAQLIFGLRARAEGRTTPYRRSQGGEFPLYDEATASVIPAAGHQSRIALKNSIVKLVHYGVISRDKYRDLEKYNGKVPSELSNVLKRASNDKIRLTRGNANHYVNLLWAVGLANHLDANKESPLVGPDLPGFASTGGWNLGKAPEGSVYFNRFPIIDLKPAEEAMAVRVAESTYRPCCNNSTFFQDCNHGSALFAALQLGASQGLTEEQLYREALACNSYWFPDYYIRTALFFKVVRNVDWSDVDVRTVMGPDFSAGGPWQQNVLAALQAFPDLIPPPTENANCGTQGSVGNAARKWANLMPGGRGMCASACRRGDSS